MTCAASASGAIWPAASPRSARTRDSSSSGRRRDCSDSAWIDERHRRRDQGQRADQVRAGSPATRDRDRAAQRVAEQVHRSRATDSSIQRMTRRRGRDVHSCAPGSLKPKPGRSIASPVEPVGEQVRQVGPVQRRPAQAVHVQRRLGGGAVAGVRRTKWPMPSSVDRLPGPCRNDLVEMLVARSRGRVGRASSCQFCLRQRVDSRRRFAAESVAGPLPPVDHRVTTAEPGELVGGLAAHEQQHDDRHLTPAKGTTATCSMKHRPLRPQSSVSSWSTASPAAPAASRSR